jgi:acyl-CoA synthetase (AMP-forming)/AMP-acid ligase II
LKVLGSVGHPIRHTEFKIVDAETGKSLPYGSKGIVRVRGPQVMKGYYKVIVSVIVSSSDERLLQLDMLSILLEPFT